jgi:acyl carrier protein
MTDSVTVLARHFEATLGPNPGNLSEPIDCQPVSINPNSIETALSILAGVSDAAVYCRRDGTFEAFVSAEPGAEVDSSYIITALSVSLPGYSLPDIHVLEGSLNRDSEGQCDFAALEEEVARLNSSAMSETALIIRDIVAELLNVESLKITAQSDFFLLGGNSLLLGRLSYHIRKKTGVTIAVPSIFTNSTIEGIAGLVQSQQGPKSSAPSPTGTMVSDDDTLQGDDIEALPATPRGHRSQNHPLIVIIQSIPAIFYNPFKSALTCKSLFIPRSFFITHRLEIIRGHPSLHALSTIALHFCQLLGTYRGALMCDSDFTNHCANSSPYLGDYHQVADYWKICSRKIPHVSQQW